MSHTHLQLDREVRLALSETVLLADAVVGENAGLQMLGLDTESAFASSRHPDDLPPTDRYLIGQRVERLWRYVKEQVWHDELADDIFWLRMVVERVFSPTVLEGYETERAADIEQTGLARVEIPAPFEAGAGDVPHAYFHLGVLAGLLGHASARLKVDQDERLAMSEIALLTGKRDATITTTAYRKVFPTYEEGGKRYAEVVDVLPWLEANGYVPTQGIDYHDIPERARDLEDEFLFVPVARDGSVFAPSCAAGGRHTIGPKGQEQKFDDFLDALAELQRMDTPRWRRPSPKGIPSIVTGVRFERMRRSQINSL